MRAMTLRDQLLTLCEIYCSARGISRARVSTLVFNGGHVLNRVVDGGDVTTGSFERAVQWFSDNWPDGVEWPAETIRPQHGADAA